MYNPNKVNTLATGIGLREIWSFGGVGLRDIRSIGGAGLRVTWSSGVSLSGFEQKGLRMS